MKFVKAEATCLLALLQDSGYPMARFSKRVRELTVDVLTVRYGFTPNQWRQNAKRVLASTLPMTENARILLTECLGTKNNPAIALDHTYTVKDMVIAIKRCQSAQEIEAILLKTEVLLVANTEHAEVGAMRRLSMSK